MRSEKEIGQEWTSRPRDQAHCGLDEDFQRWSKAKDTAGPTSQDVQLGPGPHAKVAFVQVLTRKYRYHVQVFARLQELPELELFLYLFNFLKHHIKQFAVKRMILFIIFKHPYNTVEHPALSSASFYFLIGSFFGRSY